MIKKYLLVSSVILMTTPLMANNLVCPALKYNHIKNVTKDGSEFVVDKFRFALQGFASLPNWQNPITIASWAPVIVSVEYADTAMLKCNYSYKTLMGNKYNFSIQAVIDDKTLMALAAMGYRPDTTFSDMHKEYKKKALILHPDKGGSKEVMQKLNDGWGEIKEYFVK